MLRFIQFFYKLEKLLNSGFKNLCSIFLMIKYNHPRLGQIAKQLDVANLFVKKFSVVFGDLAASTWYLKALLEAILMQIPRHGE